MLILTRNRGQSVVINGEITLTILGTQGQQVRIGFEAPKDVTIHREEVQRIINEKRGYDAKPTEHV